MMTGFEKLNEIFDGLNEAAAKIMEETIEYLRGKELNAGKTPDDNGMSKRVLLKIRSQK